MFCVDYLAAVRTSRYHSVSHDKNLTRSCIFSMSVSSESDKPVWSVMWLLQWEQQKGKYEMFSFQPNSRCYLQSRSDHKSQVYKTKSSATAEIARDAWNGHSWSLKVIRCCANRRGIRLYNFLLALNSNLTSISNRSWDITSSLHIHAPPLFQLELEKDDWE